MRKKFCHIRKMNCSIWYKSRKCLLAGKSAIIIFSNQNPDIPEWKKNNYQCVFFLIIGRLWKQLILWINAITSCLPFAWIACSVKYIFISIGKIRKTNYLLVKWARREWSIRIPFCQRMGNKCIKFAPLSHLFTAWPKRHTHWIHGVR